MKINELEITTGYNRRLAKKRVQFFNEALCFVSSLVLADSFVLRNRQLLKPANRYAACFDDSANTNFGSNL